MDEPAERILVQRIGRLLRVLPVLVLLLVLATEGVGGGFPAAAKTTLLRNQEYGEELLKAIRGARGTILVSFYLFKTGDSRSNIPRRIAEELIAARRRGVSVTVYLEKKRSRTDALNDDNRRTALLLERGGVKVRFDSPRITTHTKAVVIDHRFVFLGSHNLTQSALRHNNELSILVDSSDIAAEVEAYFDRL